MGKGIRKRTLRPLAALALASLAAGTAGAQQLKVVETDELRLLYFDPTETYLVPRIIQTFHDSLDAQEKILGWTPSDKTTVLLTDFADYGNAGASSVPANSVIVDIAPVPFTFETTSPAERMYTLMNHEMVHVATMDQPNDGDNKARRFFRGKVLATAEHPETILYQYLTAPRKSSPRWYLEGIAVFQETWMAGGLGRSQGGYDEMVFRSKVRDGAHFYDSLGLVSEGIKVDFQVGANAYLYGERFMSWLAYEYGPDKLVQWVSRDNSSRRYYESDFERVYGLPLNDAWLRWIEHERIWQQANLQRLREYPVTEHKELSNGALGSVSRAYIDKDRNSLIAGVRYPGVVAHIGEYSLETRSMDRLQDVKIPMLYRVSSVAYDSDSETVFYTADNYAYRDIMAIDLATRETRMLLEDARIGEIVFNPDDRSLWGIRHLNGYAALVRIPYPYDNWQLIETFPYGEVAYDLDISPDGAMLSGSFGSVDGKQTLKVFAIEDLLEERFKPVNMLEFGQAVPEGFVFSPDGRYLFGSAYYTGVSNIFRFELATDELEAVSNTETGYFRPIPIDNEHLIVFHYTGEGFVPVRIAATPIEDVNAIEFFGTAVVNKYPELREWRAGLGDSPPAESRIVSEGDYIARENMRLESLFPIVLGYKDSESLGLKAIFTDPIRLDMLSVGAAYSVDSDLPSDERLNLSVDYRHTVVSSSPLSGTWRFGARLNYADFYDLFGPTKTSRKGQRYFAGYEKTLLNDEPRRLAMSTELNHYRDLDALPRYQNVSTTFDELTTFDIRLSFENLRRSLGAVDDEKGYLWNLASSISYVDSDTIPKFVGNFDIGFPLPLKNSSIWLRNSAGVAFGDEGDEFANFYFGGYGNNYVDRGSIKRYRDFYALPGFELNAVPGRNFWRGMIEWNLPPVRFERAGTSSFYLAWARPAIFATGLVTNMDKARLRNNAKDVGFQVDLHFTVMSRFDMTLSTGYAWGYGEGSFSDDEFLISLKIM